MLAPCASSRESCFCWQGIWCLYSCSWTGSWSHWASGLTHWIQSLFFCIYMWTLAFPRRNWGLLRYEGEDSCVLVRQEAIILPPGNFLRVVPCQSLQEREGTWYTANQQSKLIIQQDCGRGGPQVPCITQSWILLLSQCGFFMILF